ncbi:MAG: membrane-bound lytic murein transglycosylase MltF [Gammaproteobacteria bacterium]|nr:membrane-bound lytic murein transglycosylase MltF [Gammaproteobacteria bacterium]
MVPGNGHMVTSSPAPAEKRGHKRGAEVLRTLESWQWKAGILLGLGALVGTCAHPPSLLEEVQSGGELRVVTRNGPTTYYTAGTGPLGLEYDLLRSFAKYLGVELRVLVVDRAADVLPAVAEGRAHVAAAGLSAQDDPAHRVAFGPSYQQVTEHLVYREGRRRPRNLAQLRSKRIEVASGSNYARTLAKAQQLEPGLVWTENPHADQQELLLRVVNGTIDYTVVKSDSFALYRSYMPELRVAFNLAEGESIAWAFPGRADPSLREEAAKYLASIRASGELNRLLDHYYSHMPRVEHVGTQEFMRDVRSVLPKYRATFEAAAARTGLDWRLLAAIGYQESRWDPAAVSPTGVRGLMMLTEETAATFNVAERTDPVQSIQGGARLFAQLQRKLPKSVNGPDRVLFALAAYNLGLGHVLDARRITRDSKGNWDTWKDVRPSIRLLADPRHAERTRHGFARGGEALNFVNNVRTYYDMLRWTTRDSDDEAIWTQQQSAPPILEASADNRASRPRSSG